MKLFTFKLTGIAVLLLLLAGCAEQANEDATTDVEPATDFTEAVAVIHPTEGNEVTGTVTLSMVENGVNIQADISGLSEGLHGFHIHQYGDCRAADGTSAGGHYAPDEGSEHGAPTDPNSHDGDLGNIEADADSNATLNITSQDITMNGAKSIMGRGIVIHSGEDDYESQPSGAAGSRVACGVIGIANPDVE